MPLRMFELDEEQIEKLRIWLNAQRAKKKGLRTAIGGAITYSFTPTSLGTVVKVHNAVTNEEIDLSDYESW